MLWAPVCGRSGMQQWVRSRVCPQSLAMQVCAQEGEVAREGQPRLATELVKLSLSRSLENL